MSTHAAPEASTTGTLFLEEKASHSFGPGEWENPERGILRVARERWGAGTFRPGLIHDYYTLYVILEGGFRYGPEHSPRLTGGHAMLFRPGEPRHLSCGRSSGTAGIFLFQGEEWATDIEAAFPEDAGVTAIYRMNRVTDLFDQALEEALATRARAHRVCSHLLEMVLIELARGAMESKHRHLKGWSKFKEARHYLDENWRSIDSIRELADQVGISHAYLCRLFVQHEGVSPLHHLTRLKVKAAADELVRTDALAADIALKFNFSDQFSFSRTFKRIMGEPPSAYAARHRGQRSASR